MRKQRFRIKLASWDLPLSYKSMSIDIKHLDSADVSLPALLRVIKCNECSVLRKCCCERCPIRVQILLVQLHTILILPVRDPICPMVTQHEDILRIWRNQKETRNALGFRAVDDLAARNVIV